ncbi:MAG: fluoride efflux transporter CrcB [Muribaculaceae bacterium]|nr:fluoride efflux transporter CrcB [Muribaculaceae bacterium]
MFKSMLIVGLGGFIGSCGRFLVGKWACQLYHGPFPLGTFLVNIVGCFILGILFGLLERTNLLSSNECLFLITGFCGGFTTFSTFSNETWVMIQKGEWITFALYLTLSIICGILCVWAGRAIIR